MKNKTIKVKSYIHDDEYYYQILRENIRKLRMERNLTQQDLADMIEMSRDYVCDIENENRRKHPTISVIGRIAEALDVEIGELFKKNK